MRATDFAELRAFAAVIRHGSFTRAAAHLGLSPSALSQTIRSLEERMGKRLLNRTTRSVAPSHAGQQLADRLLPVLDDLDGVLAAAAADAGEVAGPLRLTAARVALPLLSRIVPGFLRSHPGVVLSVEASDALVDIVRGGFDAGIRLAERLEADMVAVPFGGPLRMAVVGAPDYIARHGTPVHPRDLAAHVCNVTPSPSTGSPYRWEFERDGEELRISVQGPLTAQDAALRLATVEAGLALDYFFEDTVRDRIARGTLVRLLEDWTLPFPGCSLYFPSRRHPPPALRAFLDFLKLPGAAEAQRPA
jgi:DNA-binding transcriptional LysR family regulator